MPPNDFKDITFLTRKMLDFEHATTFGLRVNVQSAVADSQLFIRGATKSGTFIFKILPGDTGAIEIFNFPLPDIPIWVSVDDSSPLSSGVVFVSLAMTINGDIMHALLSGYVWKLNPLTWPITNLEKPVPLIGDPIGYNATDPAAGAQISVTVPERQIWDIRTVKMHLITDATVANRRVHLRFWGNANLAYECISSVDQAASLTRRYTGQANLVGGAASDDDDIIIPIPQNIWLYPGGRITTTTTNMQAGDDWTSPSIGGFRFFGQ